MSNTKRTYKRNLKSEVTDIRAENQLLDTMLNSLVDLLEEKGVLHHDEWERKIKERISSR